MRLSCNLLNRQILALVNFIHNNYMETCAEHSCSLIYYFGLKADKLLFASLAERENDSTKLVSDLAKPAAVNRRLQLNSHSLRLPVSRKHTNLW